MTGNTIAEMHLIIDAIAEGKKIQFQHLDTNHPGEWKDIPIDGDFRPNFADAVHRIKPEEHEKRWRPFKDTAELFAHNNGSDILWLKSKDSPWRRMVTSYGKREITFDSDVELTMNDLFNGYTFADGTPCGMEEA